MKPGTRLLALGLSVAVAGCGWKVTPPAPGERVPLRRVADRVVLRADEGAVAWGGGRMGETLRERLQASGVFGDVAYPVEPRHPPPLRLEVLARGTVDEEEVLGTFKAIVIGALFLIPSGIIRFDKTFELEADVTLREAEREVFRLPVRTSTRISHTLFSQVDRYEAEARRVAFGDLAERIAVAACRSDLGSGVRPP